MSTARCPECDLPLTAEEAMGPICPSCGSSLNSRADRLPPDTFEDETDYVDVSLSGLKGNAGKERLLASICDNLVSVILPTIIVSTSNLERDVLRFSLFVITYLAYYFLSEWLLGATIGKFAFGLRVRRVTGERCTWLGAGIRTLLRFIEVNPLLLGGIPAIVAVLATRRHQRLGDLLAGTIVISKSDMR